MAIAYGTPGTALNQTTAATSWAVPYPSGVAANDLLVLHMATAANVTTPSGWTQIYSETVVTNPKGGLWIKKAAGTETGTLTVTLGSSAGAAQIHLYTGVDTTTPQDATATNVSLNATTDTTIDIPAITTVTNGAWAVYACASNSTSTTHTAPDNERQDFAPTIPKAGALYDAVITTAGTTGVKTITQLAGRAYWGAMLVLRPAAGGGTPATVTAVKATGTSAGVAPAASAGASVTSVKGTGTSGAPAPVVQVAPTVQAVKATGSGTALAPTVTLGTTVQAVKATSTASAVVPGLSAGSTTTLSKASGTSTAVPPAVSAGSLVTSVKATGTSAAPAPAVSVVAAGSVQAVRATATGASPAPGVAVPALVTGVKATSTGSARVPVVSGAARVTPPKGTGTTGAPAPVLSAGGTALVPPVALSGAALVPSLTAGASLQAVTAGATALLVAPVAWVEPETVLEVTFRVLSPQVEHHLRGRTVRLKHAVRVVKFRVL